MRMAIASLALLLAPLAARGGENLTPEALLPGHEATDAREPVAAFGKDVFLLVWRAGRNEGADLVGLRLDKAGRALDAKPFVVSNAKECQDRPRVAFGPSSPGGSAAASAGVFLVVWQDLRNGKDWDVYAARVTPEGKVLDPDGIAVAAEKHNQCQPAVCFDPSAGSGQGGGAFQLLWRDFRDGVAYDLFGGRVGLDGRALDGTGVFVMKRFVGAFGDTFMPAPGVGANGKGEVLAAAGSHGLTVWPMSGGKPSGKAQSLQTCGLFNKNCAWDPLFASDGERLLVAFTTFRPVSRGGSDPKAGAILLEANPVIPKDGKPKTPVALSDKFEWESSVRNPSPAWDGTTYVVAWDMRRALPQPARGVYDAVTLRRVSAEGKPLGADVEVAGEHASPAYHPAAASDGAGTTIIAYERHPKTPETPIKIAVRVLTK